MADLSSLFTWNTKQVFVYITASFPASTNSLAPSAKHPYSEAIIWDAIIPASSAPWHPNTYIHPNPKTDTKKQRDRKIRASKKGQTVKEADEPKAYPTGAEPGIVRLSSQKPKYQITTPTSKIAGLSNCTLELHYNIQPWVGALIWSTPSKHLWSPGWTPLTTGKSEAFDMPELKAVTGTKSKEDLGTETGGEANRGSPA